MRKIKHISKLNLVLFLCSFSLLCVNNLSAVTKNLKGDVAVKANAKQGDLPDSTPQQLLENETEKEGDFEMLAILIPFFVIAFNIELFLRIVRPSQHLTEVNPQPIYISNRNFRV